MSGYWVNEIPRANSFAPCPDSGRAWLWSSGEAGVKLVDTSGAVIVSDPSIKLESPHVLGLTCRLLDFVRDPGFHDEGSVVVLDAVGQRVSRSDVVRTQYQPRVAMVRGADRAWLIDPVARSILLLDLAAAAPNVHTWNYPAGAGSAYPEFADVGFRSACVTDAILRPTPPGQNPWLAPNTADLLLLREASPQLLRVGPALLHTETTPHTCAVLSDTSWVIVDDEGHTATVVAADGTLTQAAHGVFPPELHHVPKNDAGYWLAREAKGVLLLDPDGHGHELLPSVHIAFGSLSPLVGSRRAIAVDYSNVVHLIDPDSGEVPIRPALQVHDHDSSASWFVEQDPAHLDEVWLQRGPDGFSSLRDGRAPPTYGTFVVTVSGDAPFGGAPLFPGLQVAAVATVADSPPLGASGSDRRHPARIVITRPDPATKQLDAHVIDGDGRQVGPDTHMHDIGTTGHAPAFAWIPTRDRLRFVRPAAADLRGGLLLIGKTQCDLLAGADCVTFVDTTSESFRVAADLDWPAREGAEEHDPTVQIDFLAIDNAGNPGALVASTGKIRLGSDFGWSDGGAGIDEGKPYGVRVTYSDSLGSWVQTLPKRVVFAEAPLALIDRIWFRTGVVFLTILAALGLFLRTRAVGWSVGRWLPAVAWTASSAGSLGLGEKLAVVHVDGGWLLGLLVATLLAFVGTGFVSPSILRVLAQTAPADRLVRFGLLVSPRFRRRAYAGYTAKHAADLGSERVDQAAGSEVYVAVPAVAKESPTGQDRVEATPAQDIAKRLGSPGNGGAGARILVEAGGGTGKSALLRRVRELLLAEHAANARTPLPVALRLRSADIYALVREALGRFVVSDDLIPMHLASGHFALIFDGLSESGLEPAKLREFLEGETGFPSPVLCSTRPSDAYRAALDSDHRLLRVEPRLDEETLPAFIRAYSNEDQALPDHLRRVCRAPDGTGYLPILVRLSLITGPDAVVSVGALYDRAFRRLLRRKGDVFEEADESLLAATAAFCLRTYFKNGQRSLAFLNQPAEERTILEPLLNAGIIVPVRQGPTGEKPREVRFFHDSMQSYLTALGLFQSGDWGALFEAAGAERFVGSGRESELFRMCTEVFVPEGRLRDALHTSLDAASRKASGGLARDTVAAAMAPKLRAVAEQRAIHSGTDELIRAALEVCREQDGDERPCCVIDLVAALAPLLWRVQQRAPQIAPAVAVVGSAELSAPPAS